MVTRQEIEGLYTGILGRAPDQAGLDWWAQQANSGAVTLADIQRNFQGVAQAGSDPLKPQANPLLVQDSQRTTPAQPNSPQANPLIPQTYAAHDPALLERARGIGAQISAGGVPSADLMAQYESAADDLVYGTKPTGVTPGIGEALTSIYQNTLGRLPDAAGAEYWTKAFNDGMTLQQIEASIRSDKESQGRQPVYSDNPLFAGNEWTPPALAGRSMARMGLPYLQGGGTFDPNAPITADNVIRTVDEWKGYNSTLGTPNQQPVNNQSFKDNANQIYSGISSQGLLAPTQPTGTTQSGVRPPQGLLAPSTPVPGQYSQGNIGAPPGSFPRPAPNYWNGNDFVIPHFQTPTSRPTTPLLPTAISGGNASTATSSTAPTPVSSTPGIVAAGAVPAIAGLVGSGGSALINGLSAIPGGAALVSALGMQPEDVAGMELSPEGKLRPISGTAEGTSRSAAFAQNFNEALKPGWMNTLGAGLAALPDILQGNYTQGIGAGLGTYVGGAAGTAAGAGLGGVLGNFIIPGIGSVAGGLLGRELGGLFGPGKSVGPNAGANLAVNNGMAQFQSSGADNNGNTQYVDQFINAVAMGANEAARNAGVRLADGGYRVAVEAIGGKLNVVGADGVKKSFNPDQGKEAYEYAVQSLLKSGAG